MRMNNKTIRGILQDLPKAINALGKRIDWQKAAAFLKNNQGVALFVFSFLGLSGGYFLRQPEINRYAEDAKCIHSENARLRALVQHLREEFLRKRAEIDILKAKGYAKDAKIVSESGRGYIMYQYATKEYIELYLRPCDDNGMLTLSEEEHQFYLIFQRVINGEDLEEGDEKRVFDYIYPKYKEEIVSLTEFDFEELLKKLQA